MGEATFGLSVKALVTDAEGRFLIIQRSHSSRLWPGVWDLPGGKVDRGESFDAALKREAREETGLEIVLDGLAGALEWPIEAKRIIFLVISGRSKSEQVRLSDEHESYRWVRLDELAGLPLVDPIASIVRGMRPGDPHRRD